LGAIRNENPGYAYGPKATKAKEININKEILIRVKFNDLNL